MSRVRLRRYRGWAWLLLATACAGPAVARAQTTDRPPASREDRRPAAALDGTDPAYVRWLEERSLLYQAGRQARAVSGSGVQWRHPVRPRPRLLKLSGDAQKDVLTPEGRHELDAHR